MAKYNPSNTMMLDENLLRVQYESMRCNFKSLQKDVERDTTYLKNASSDAGNLDAMIQRVQALKEKTASAQHEQERLLESTQARTKHLDKLFKIKGLESGDYEQWSRTRLDVLLVDYFIRNGYMETATLLTETKGIQTLVDIQLLQECFEIKQALLNKETASCLNWCSENKAYLKKVRNALEFDVRMQCSIELIKAGKTTEAVQYSRKHLSKSADTQLHTIQQLAGMMAFSADTQVDRYREWFSGDRWQVLADRFMATFFNLHGLSQQPQLIEALATGISVLKTHSCILDDPNRKPKVDLSRAQMCPVCSVELNSLAEKLPFALHNRCLLDSEMVMLPNNCVYGKEKLMQFSRKAGAPLGKVCDPASLELFEEDEMRLVYPT